MKTLSCFPSGAIACLSLVPVSVLAGGPVVEEPVAPASRWSYTANLSLRFNLEARFSGLGRWVSPNPLLPLGSGADRTYDDGYNRVDSTGNAGGLTSFWGVEFASQFDQLAPGTISMNRYQSSAAGSVTEDGDNPQVGFEFTARYDMGAIDGIVLSGEGLEPAHWGWSFGLGLESIQMDNSAPLSVGYSRTSDTYASGPVFVGIVPYAGPYVPVPGAPLIPDNPLRSETKFPSGATVVGDRDIDVFLVALNAGPWLRVPVAKNLSADLEAGVTVALAQGDYKFSSQTTIPGVGSQFSAGSDSTTKVLPGFYVGAGFNYEISKNWSAHLGVRYQYLKEFSLSAGGSKVELDSDSSVVLLLGTHFTF